MGRWLGSRGEIFRGWVRVLGRRAGMGKREVESED